MPARQNLPLFWPSGLANKTDLNSLCLGYIPPDICIIFCNFFFSTEITKKPKHVSRFQLVSLESRIKHLESCLRGSSECGQSEQISDMEGKSLGERVELLQQRIQMQDPSYLEGIEARLNAILQKYNKVWCFSVSTRKNFGG